MPAEPQEISTREDAGWRRFDTLGEFLAVDAKVIPKKVEIHVGELRIESDPGSPIPGGVKIFLDGKKCGNTRDATLHLPLEGVPTLDIQFILGLKGGKS